jgi:hypothetical protein
VTDQVSVEQVCKAGKRPSPYRARLRGGVTDQVPTEQVCVAGRPTKYPLSKPARGVNNQVPVEQACEAGQTNKAPPNGSAKKELGPTQSPHDDDDKTQHYQTTPGPYIQNQKVSNRHDGTPPRAPLDMCSLTHGASQLRLRRPHQRSLYSGPYTRKDETISHTGRIPTHA